MHGSGLRRIWWLPPLPRGAQVFEIGHGAGQFREECRLRGWHWAGCDPHAERFGARCRAEDFPFPIRIYDAVVAWQSLEHLDDPGTVLRRALQALRPSGYLVVAVPNTRSLERYVMGDQWDGWQRGEHKSWWDAKSLTALLRETGFHVERVLYQRQVKHLPGGFALGALLAAFGLSGRMTVVARPA